MAFEGVASTAEQQTGKGALTSTNKHDWLYKRQRIYWYDQYALNEQETAFSKYDPDRIASELKATGADIVAVYAANQFSVAYYPSKVWPMHPNLNGRDYFGEVSSRLKRQGQKVIAYINWLESRHPEWYVVPIGGKKEQEIPLASWAQPDNPDWRVQKVPGGKWRFACINSPRREQVLAVTREIIEGYHPDGFHLDMFFNDCVCVCDYCRPTLERICGTSDITAEAVNAHWREFVDWRNECSASLVGEVSSILREHGVFAAHNGQNPLWLSPIYGFDRNLVPHLDPYVSEIFYDLHAADITMRWHQAIGKPSCMLITGTSPSHAHLSIPLQAWQVSAACAKANGCSILGPCGVGAYPDTTSSKRLLNTVRQGLDFFMQDADLHDGARPKVEVGLVFSWATRKYFREGRLDWSQELDGWSRVLIEEHIPFEIVVAENIKTAEELRRYRLLILPNTSFLSDIFCDALAGYVRGGGNMIATGEVSLGDERGNNRDDFALGNLLGVTRKNTEEETFAMEGSLEAEPAAGVFQQVETTAQVLHRRVATDPAGPVAGGPDPLPILPTEWPVSVLKKTGEGQTLYVAFGLGRYYVLQSLIHARDRMTEYINLLMPTRQLKVKAPKHLKVNVWHQDAPERIIIHLANRTPLAHDMPKIHEIAPVCDVAIEIENPYPSARISFRGTEGTASFNGKLVAVKLPRMEVYAAVLIEAIDTA